uniref:Uncharacterized protein n=1 Tax=Mucochytrium quahogii TaxID=96639 RepID=A0A7S2SLX4_9STRA
MPTLILKYLFKRRSKGDVPKFKFMVFAMATSPGIFLRFNALCRRWVLYVHYRSQVLEILFSIAVTVALHEIVVVHHRKCLRGHQPRSHFWDPYACWSSHFNFMLVKYMYLDSHAL